MGCCSSYSRDEFQVLMLGLDAAGKTDILYRSLLQKKNFPVHTFGNVFNVEPVTIYSTNLTIWEVAGQEETRRLWVHYFCETQGIIYVIDANDKERIDEAKDTLFNIILSHPDIESHTNIPLLILCNKQDLPLAMNSDEIWFILGLFEPLPPEPYYTANETLSHLIIDTIFSYLFHPKSVLNGRPIHVQQCCGITTEGVMQGMRWFIEKIKLFNEYTPRKLAIVNSMSRNGESLSRYLDNIDKDKKEVKRIKKNTINIYNERVAQLQYVRDAVHTLNNERVASSSSSSHRNLVPILEEKSVKEKAKMFTQIAEKEKPEKVPLRAVKRKKLKKKSRVVQMALNFDEVVDPIVD